MEAAKAQIEELKALPIPAWCHKCVLHKEIAITSAQYLLKSLTKLEELKTKLEARNARRKTKGITSTTSLTTVIDVGTQFGKIYNMLPSFSDTVETGMKDNPEFGEILLHKVLARTVNAPRPLESIFLKSLISHTVTATLFEHFERESFDAHGSSCTMPVEDLKKVSHAYASDILGVTTEEAVKIDPMFARWVKSITNTLRTYWGSSFSDDSDIAVFLSDLCKEVWGLHKLVLSLDRPFKIIRRELKDQYDEKYCVIRNGDSTEPFPDNLIVYLLTRPGCYIDNGVNKMCEVWAGKNTHPLEIVKSLNA